MKRLLFCMILSCFVLSANAQHFDANKLPVSKFSSPDWPGSLVPANAKMEKIDELLPVRGLAIAAPSRAKVDLFCKFIEEELAPAHFNMLVLRVDWNYAYECYPQLRDPDPLTKEDAKKIVAVCRKHNIQIAPQVNLLGHQSWAETTYALLREFPEFDETPHISTADYDKYLSENGYTLTYSDALYCKSYCPLHPDVHTVVFAVIDELLDAFEANWFHAGMDEVFHLGSERCPRCAGIPKDKLYADEVNRIADHLAQSNRRLMIWGDRLLDGRPNATGYGDWEASYNYTSDAIKQINKDVFICDWHYGSAGLSAVQIAFNGLDVALCPWNDPAIADEHLNDMLDWHSRNMKKAVTNRFQGIIDTVWSGADGFLDLYYNPATYEMTKDGKPVNSRGGDARALKLLISRFKELAK